MSGAEGARREPRAAAGVAAWLVAAIAAWPGALAAAAGPEYFVATTGSDRSPGTRARPFATLARAQAAVRAARRSGLPAGGVTVTIRAGAYRLADTLVMGSADSGMAGRPVLWRAYPGEMPRVHGGKPVSGWTAVTSADPNWARIHASRTLYQARIGMASFGAGPPGTGALAELFYRGQPMQLGRWPKGSAWIPARGGPATLDSAVPLPSRNWAAAAALPPPNRPWAHVNTNGFADQVISVLGVSANAIRLDGMTLPLDSQAVWYAVNLLEEVADPGEYWIDRVAGVVYFRPPDDANPDRRRGTALVSELDGPLVWLDDSSSHIQFEGITFEVGKTHLLVVHGAHHAFRSCTFRNGSEAGIVLFGKGHTVDRSSAYGLGSGGLVTAGSSSAINISNTDVHHVARRLHNGNAGMAIGGRGHTIRHNRIHDLPWSGIALNAKNTVVELNEFFATQQHGCDSGTIYAGGTDTGTVISDNYFHDVDRPAAPCLHGRAAVYIDTDPGSPDASGFQVLRNVFYRYGDGAPAIARQGIAIINKGSSNTFRNNLLVRVDVPYVASYLGSSGRFTQNYAWMTGAPLPAENVYQDPGFADEAHAKLMNRADGSIALTGASKSIPFSRMGIR